MKELQNCVKAMIAFVCTTCNRQLLLALLQLITFVCTTAIDNFLCTTAIVNFCMHYCKMVELVTDRQRINILTSRAAKTTSKYFTTFLITSTRIETIQILTYLTTRCGYI